MQELVICIIIIVLSITAGAKAIKVSKILAAILYMCGMLFLIPMCEMYHERMLLKEVKPVCLEQEVQIITYRYVGDYKIPIDTIITVKSY